MALFGKGVGIHVPHHKNTSQAATEVAPVPAKIYLPMQQHIGAPATPVVAKDDIVYVGTLVGKAGGYISSDIYSGVSGTVTAIEEMQFPDGKSVTTVVIESDGKQEIDPGVKAPVVENYESFVEAVQKAGLVGLGGAGFPTSVKLSPENLDEVNTLIINGAECEPFITADDREFLECADEVMEGIALVKKYLSIDKVFIGIEDNKQEAIALMKEKAQSAEGVEVASLPARYPQGAEKTLIMQVTGKQVPRGKLPASIGVLVMNVATISYIAKYLKTGMPLVTKRVTVDGDAITTPKNVEVIVGTPVKDVIAFCDGYKGEVGKLIAGGPMMGTALQNDDFPIRKTDNAILCFGTEAAKVAPESACIHCGRCIDACPMLLSPVEIAGELKKKNKEGLDALMVDLCIECGSCSYACPAKIQVTQKMRLAKAFQRTGGKK